ncbi:sulfotransferase family protein [Rhizobium oryziradicis]|uniref:sulfotransferase family protein n=1 Tax=Rhizobium oryziradicis TaxID=1867956 RepID=UPI0009FA68F9|nr:sulfotransferase [Rhizobium oryziradicis]
MLDSRNQRKIDIFCCGVQKGGTTSLHAYFCNHPQLDTPKFKELHFFDNEDLDWNAPNYGLLDDYFNNREGDKRRYDITPIYLFWPQALERLQAYNPDAKLIFLFRDPFERAWSQWCMEYARKSEDLPFSAAIREGRDRLSGKHPQSPEFRVYTYLERGFYGQQVERALRLFPREQLLFLKSETFRTDHLVTLRHISDFLGIARFAEKDAKSENAQPPITYPCAPTEDDRLLFQKALRQDLTKFSRLTGLDIFDWPTF